MSSKNYDTAVLIGRFQPIHAAHLKIFERALDEANKLIVFVGSAREVRTIQNPWTFEQRKTIIERAVKDLVGEEQNPAWQPGPMEPSVTKRLEILPARDYLYEDGRWAGEIYSKATRFGASQDHNTAIYGCVKDDWTDEYLRMFSRWRFERMPYMMELDSTDIRKQLFETGEVLPARDKIMPSTSEYLNAWIDGDTRYADEIRDGVQINEHLLDEWKHYKKEEERWAGHPYDNPQAATSDSLVLQNGHILLIRRKIHPGKGLLALPGGYVGRHESTRDAAIRELREETNIEIHKDDLETYVADEPRVFDHPQRCLGPLRKITNVYRVELPPGEFPIVDGGDDAAEADWYPLPEVHRKESEFFEDHYHIISQMTGNY
jgi:bifunctional NMN adenylyltransferase/nudix hydrolase